MRRLTASPPADFTAVNQAAFADLGVTAASFTGGPMRTSGDTARQNITEHLALAGLGQVSVTSTISLVNRGGHWLVSWTPATITPRLRAGDKLEVRTSWPARAQILGAGGASLTTQAQQEVTTALAGAKANPTYFEPVYTLSWARYQQLKPAIYPLPGTVFQTQAQRTAITPGLADGIVASRPRAMMAQVVASGTAAGQGLPAGTYAKTGTAQYGTGKTLKIDAWLIGFRKNIAFAVLVSDSPGNGGPTDGPIAARFLNALSR